MQQITTGIFCKLFPFLLKPQEAVKTVIDGQGDHGAEMSAKHYGRTQDLQNGQNNLDAAEYIQASRMYQALMQIEPLDSDWPKEVLDSPALSTCANTELASHAAHWLIVSECALCVRTPAENIVLLSKMLQTLLFLFSPPVHLILSMLS